MSSTKYIEFIGPSGVGKSTLFEKVNIHLRNDWNYIEHINRAQLKMDDNEVGESLHWQLLLSKTKNVEKMNINGFQKINLIRYFSGVLFLDFCMLNGNYEKGFLLEEGLCHNFVQELNELPRSDFVSLMTDRAFIYLIPRDNRTVVQRLRKRQEEGGHAVTHHAGLDDYKLCSIVRESLVYYERFVNRCESANIPFCRIFAEDNISESVDTILSFENQVCSPIWGFGL